MLLPSIEKLIKDQNWFVAIIGCFIVFACILIAIQITISRNGQSDDIIDHLRADIWEVEHIIQSTEWETSALVAVLSASGNPLPAQYEMPEGELIDLPEVSLFESNLPWADYDPVLWLATIEIDHGGYAALIGSDDVSIVENDDLTPQLQAYYARIAEVAASGSSRHDITKKIRSSKQRLGIGYIGPEEKSFQEIIDIVRKDEQFAEELSDLSIQYALQIKMLKEVAVKAEALIVAIEETR